jgi:hypothetical protein
VAALHAWARPHSPGRGCDLLRRRCEAPAAVARGRIPRCGQGSERRQGPGAGRRPPPDLFWMVLDGMDRVGCGFALFLYLVMGKSEPFIVMNDHK